MAVFTHGEIAVLRHMLKERFTMERMCHFMNAHTRDEVVEGIDAIRRNETITAALRHVNHVLALQTAGEPLVNGNPQHVVCRQWAARPVYRPMF